MLTGRDPYYSLNTYFKNKYGEKCYKIAIDAGCTCPNRDGRLDTRGCIFCSAGGSGDFAEKMQNASDMTAKIRENIERAKTRFNKVTGEKYVIYFQAYTNTYGDLSYLKKLWETALSMDEVIGISIATRPDCLEDEVISALDEINRCYEEKFIWIEMGLQTIHKKTAEYIRRHFDLTKYEDACEKLNSIGIKYVTHVILGLPGEDKNKMLETVKYVCEEKRKPFGIKLQLLHVLKNTDLAKDYEEGMFETLSKEMYLDILVECIENIPGDVVLHRVTGDGPKKILISPTWSGNKKDVLNSLHRKMKQEGAYQGKKKENYII